LAKNFKKKVQEIAEEKFNISFLNDHPIPVGKPVKEHKFDLVSEDNSIVIECKCYTWTDGNNVPSTKLSTLNVAALYLINLQKITHKIIAMKKDVRRNKAKNISRILLQSQWTFIGRY